MTFARSLFSIIYILNLAAAGTAYSAPVTLGWTAPTTNVDDSPVEDLAGFHLYVRPDTNFVPGEDIIVTLLDGVNPVPQSTNEEYSVDVEPVHTAWFTVTAVDFAGNESEFSPPLLVDVEAPAITLLGPGTLTLQFGTTYIEPGYQAADDVDPSVSVTVTGSVNTGIAGTYRLYYNASDAAGNVAVEQVRTIHVTAAADIIPPVIKLLGANPLTLARGTAYVEPGFSANDDVDGNLAAQVQVSGTVNHNTVGTYTLRYNVSDSSGNAAAERTRTVRVVDQTAPVITLSGANPLTLPRGTAYVEPGFSATDDVNGNLTAQVQISGSVNHNTVGTYTLRYNVSDSSGNHAVERTRSVQVVDAGAPVIALSGANPLTLPRGTAYVEPGFSATDDVNGNLTAQVQVSGSVNHNTVGTYTLRYNVSDSSGNHAAERIRTVQVVDTAAPVITLAGANPITLSRGTPYTEPGFSATDDVDGNLTAQVQVSGSVNHNSVGTYTLRYNVSDSGGNDAAERTRSVQVVDAGAPAITLSGANPLTLARGTAYVEPGYSATDDVDGNLTAQVQVSGNVNHVTVGTYSLRYNVSDSSGNHAVERIRTVQVVDTAAPVITLSGANPLTLPRGTAYVEPGFSATDDVDGDLTAQVQVAGAVNHTAVGTYTLRYNVFDSSANAASERVRTVQVVDTASPVISLEGANPLTLPRGTAYVEPGFSATDDVDGNLTAQVQVSGSVNHNSVGTYTLRYNVSDSSANAASERVRTVQVVDAAPPVLTLSGANPLILPRGTPYAEPGYAATDDVDGNLAAQVQVAGSVNHLALGTYTLRYNVSDSAGNDAAERTRTVYVVDQTAPSITLQGANPLTLPFGTIYAEPGYAATDDVDQDITDRVQVAGTVNHTALGTYTLRYSVRDRSGNEATARVRTVRVVDAAAPSITLLGDNPLTLVRGTAYTEPGFSASDNVNGDLTSSVQVSGSVGHNTLGTYALRYNVSDSSGNAAAEQVRTVHVVDTASPVISLEGANPLTLPRGTTYVDPGFSATDDVDGDLTAQVQVSGNVNYNLLGAYTLRYNVSDSSGNAASERVRTVHVVDAAAPVITLEGANPLTLARGTAYVEPGFSATDDIDGNLTAQVQVAGSVQHNAVGTYILRYNVSDSSGNAASERVRTVHVVDAGAPVITLYGDHPLTLFRGMPYTEPGFVAIDDVDGNLTSQVQVSGSVNHTLVGTYALRYNVADSSGNDASERTRSVQVVDWVAPVITLNGANPLTLPRGTPYTEPGYSATDDVDGDVRDGVQVSGGVDHNTVGSYKLRYNVSDSSANAASERIRTVKVVDTVPPVITLEGANPLSWPRGTPFTEPGYSATDDVDGDVRGGVQVGGVVDHLTLGAYTLRYNVRDVAGNDAVERTRDVLVVDAGAPIIRLWGANPLTLPRGTPYIEPGYLAADIVDGDLSDNVRVSGDVAHNRIGTYTLRYNVSDSNGNDAVEQTRTVRVVDATAPVITLAGANPMTLPRGIPYAEPGYTATDDVDGDVRDGVRVSGAVNHLAVGTYTVRYNVGDGAGNAAVEATRTVYVVDAGVPIIDLLGANPLTLTRGMPYIEPGCTATDEVDGDVSAEVRVSGVVNTGIEGTYYRYYDVTDQAGNQAVQKTRTIHVVLAAVAEPYPIAPTGLIEEARRPVFSWQGVAGTEWYEIDIDKDGTDYYGTWIDATTFTPTWDLAPGDYAWSVRQWNTKDGLGPWSEAAEFTVIARIPAPPTPESPVGSIRSKRPMFDWPDMEHALWYNLYAQRDGETAFDVWIDGVSEYHLPEGEALRFGNYTWWVRGWGPDGMGAWSDTTTFQYGIVEPYAPAGVIAELRPVFTWKILQQALWYHVWIGKDGASYQDFWTDGTDWAPTWDMPDGDYRWYIQPWNEQGTGPWSEAGVFSIVAE